MKYNLSMYEVAIRYVLMALFVIAGAFLLNYWVIGIGLLFFMTAILGMCPIYHLLGIDHSEKAKKDFC